MARDDAATSSSSRDTPRQTLIVDPGAYTIKAGFAPHDAADREDLGRACRIIPNCIARSRHKRIYTGSQLEQCTDYGEMSFRRPVEKGYIVNWDSERAIWEHEFFDKNAPLYCDPHETSLLLTEPPNAIRALQSNSDQIIFEGFEFAAAYRTIGASLNAWNPISSLFDDPPTPTDKPAEAVLVIDVSHSHTTITPILHGRPVHAAVRRCSIGGKHLTNYLAELISLRHFSLIDEPYICEQIKRDACFVSADFAADLAACHDKRDPRREGIVVDYVLPDYEKLHRGFVRAHDASHGAKMARLGVATSAVNVSQDASSPSPTDSFPLANERFTVPELLFNPSDIGRDEQGIPETTFQSLGRVPRALWQVLLANVLVVGGTSLLPGFMERLEAGIRSLAPAECVVRVSRAPDPVLSTWNGGARLAAAAAAVDSGRCLLRDVMVTRSEYAEHGENWVSRQFATRRIV